MQTLYVHIGAHKTGSTYIQKWCSENCDILRATGVMYPKYGRDLLFGHHGLAQIVRPDYDLQAAQYHLRQEIGDFPGDVLVSSENFEYLSTEQVSALVQLFEPKDVKIIYFYRNWTPLLYSMWQEEIKHGSTMIYQEFCLHHITFPFSSRLLNFIDVIDRFAAAVGRDNMRVTSYDTVAASKNVLEQLLSIARPKQDFSLAQEIVNRSYDPFITESIRALNGIMLLRGHPRDYLVKHYFINDALRDSGECFTELSKIMTRYLTSAEDFSHCYVARVFFERFLSQYADLMVDDPEMRSQHVNSPSTPIAVVHQDYLLEPQVRKLLEGLSRPIENRLSRVEPQPQPH
jgi:hypothetical protein